MGGNLDKAAAMCAISSLRKASLGTASPAPEGWFLLLTAHVAPYARGIV